METYKRRQMGWNLDGYGRTKGREAERGMDTFYFKKCQYFQGILYWTLGLTHNKVLLIAVKSKQILRKKYFTTNKVRSATEWYKYAISTIINNK